MFKEKPNIARDGAPKKLTLPNPHPGMVHVGKSATGGKTLFVGASKTALDDSEFQARPTVEKQFAPVPPVHGQRTRGTAMPSKDARLPCEIKK